MGLLLVITARILQWAFSPLFIIYATIKLRDKKKLDAYFYDIALSIDQLGNVMGGPIMNSVLLTKESVYKYGNPDQTISHVTGVNYLNGTLSRSGRLVAKILNKIDKDHVQKAAKNDQ